jgi:hypothetical protein
MLGFPLAMLFLISQVGESNSVYFKARLNFIGCFSIPTASIHIRKRSAESGKE